MLVTRRSKKQLLFLSEDHLTSKTGLKISISIKLVTTARDAKFTMDSLKTIKLLRGKSMRLCKNYWLNIQVLVFWRLDIVWAALFLKFQVWGWRQSSVLKWWCIITAALGLAIARWPSILPLEWILYSEWCTTRTSFLISLPRLLSSTILLTRSFGTRRWQLTRFATNQARTRIVRISFLPSCLHPTTISTSLL